MTRSGFVVRFVDVVLILLFGFISISSIRETELTLPVSTEKRDAVVDVEEVIFVGIRSDGTYLVDDEREQVRGGNALHAYLERRVRSLGEVPVKVRLRASHDTPMRFLVDAGRVCDALGVRKSFEVRLRVSGE